MRAHEGMKPRYGRWLACCAFLFLFLLGLPLPGFAAGSYPGRPITLVVAFEAGGSSDISARLIAQELTRILGQQVIVENRPGAGGRPGTRRLSDATPDGYTLLWGSGSTLTVSPMLYSDQQYVKESDSHKPWRDAALYLRRFDRDGSEDGPGHCKSRQAAPGEAQFCIGRCWLKQSSPGRDIHGVHRYAVRACAVQGRRLGARCRCQKRISIDG